MTQPGWTVFFALVVANVLSLVVGLRTQPIEGADPVVNMFRRIRRNVGLIIGIGGWIPAALMLMDILRRNR